MVNGGYNFDDNYYAYYSDLEMAENNDFFIPLYIGSNMNDTNRQGKLFVISGPSGVGKTTLALELLNKLGARYNLNRVMTYTTRLPRPGERDGIDYHFITDQEFVVKLEQGFFIEYSKAYGFYYGSPKSIINDLKLGKSFVLVVDQAGACNIKQQFGGAILIWITPPSLDELANRLQRRRTDSLIDIEKRLAIAKQEMLLIGKSILFDYVIENNVLEHAVTILIKILKAEISSESIY